MRMSLAIATLGSMLVASVAVAQTPTGAPTGAPSQAPAPEPGRAGLAACRADMQTLCGGQQGGGRGARFQCLIQNRDKVSPQCAATLAAIGERGPQGKAARQADRVNRPGFACRGDVQALCGSAERGAARQQCLRDHQGQLSQPCRDALANLMTLRREARAACREDRRSLCGNVERGAARQQCLRENVSRVSPACSAALAQLPGNGKAPR